MWSAENPHYYVEQSLHPQKIGVWAAISQRKNIGPTFFEGNNMYRVMCHVNWTPKTGSAKTGRRNLDARQLDSCDNWTVNACDMH
jgi:hypothetical protein